MTETMGALVIALALLAATAGLFLPRVLRWRRARQRTRRIRTADALERKNGCESGADKHKASSNAGARNAGASRGGASLAGTLQIMQDQAAHLMDDMERGGLFHVECDVSRLSDLTRGERGQVVEISSQCRGLERRRLLDLGFLPGAELKVELTSPGGDPVAYRIRGALIALRKEQADLIQIRPLGQAA